MQSHGLQTEWLIVILAVASAIFSAVSFWESTRFGDESADLMNQARFADTQEAHWRSSVETKIAHDRSVALGCQSAMERRDGALLAYSRVFDDRSIRTVISAEQTRIALESHFIAYQTTCDQYDVGHVFEFERFGRVQSEFDSDLLATRSLAFGEAEQLAVLATVTFAVAVLVLTLADSTQHPVWLRRWLLLATMLIALAVVFTSISTATSPELPVLGFVLVVVFALMLGGLVWTLRRAGTTLSRRISFGKSVRWWAEVLGAATLVLLTVAAFGFSQSRIRERESLGAADALAAESRQALDISNHSSLSILGFVQQLAELNADEAGFLLEPDQVQADGPGSGAEQVAKEAVLEIWASEQLAWEDLLEEQATSARAEVSNTGCLSPDLVLPWRVEGVAASSGGSSLPAVLMADYREDQSVFGDLIARSSMGSAACAARAAVQMQQAQGWGDRTSAFTAAIVVLGLAGFLFALAADPDRSRDPRHWLLGAATMGLLVGMGASFIAWFSGPPEMTDRAIEQGTLALASSEIGLYLGECERARDSADEAALLLPEFAPARVARAIAYACSEGSDWLVDPRIRTEFLDVFRADLDVAANELGKADSSVVGNLGWAYLLSALQDTSVDPDREANIERGGKLTLEALRSDPSNPILCFNWALAGLLEGRLDVAQERYENAMVSLRGESSDAGECESVKFEHPGLRTHMKLLALADIELLPSSDHYDEIRGLVVQGDSSSNNAGPALPEGFSLEVLPTGLSLEYDGQVSFDHSMSIIWYYRQEIDRPWTLMIGPTDATLEAGSHLGYWELGLLPDGEFRADVFVEGYSVGQVVAKGSYWSAQGLDASNFRRVQIPDLGLRVVVPNDWVVLSETPGVEIVYGSDDGAAAFRRIEGAAREDLENGLNAWSETWFEGRGIPSLTAEESSELSSDSWYLGFEDHVSIQLRDDLYRGAGHSQYLTASEDRYFSIEDVAHATCPGTTVMTLIQADLATARTVWLSQELYGQLFSVSVEEMGLTGHFASPHFSVDIPTGWIAAGCPANFVALEGEADANFLVDSEAITTELPAYVDAQIAAYQTTTDFANFVLLERKNIELSNGVPAEEIAFTWTSGENDVQQTQIFSAAGDRMYFLTFTTLEINVDLFEDELIQITQSFQVGQGPGSTVLASCPGCAPADRELRQANIDELASFIATVATDCRDVTTGTSARAVISCDRPGGFSVDFSLWPDRAALDASAASFQADPETVFMEWRLYGDSEVRTGITLEWVEDRGARFFWTYEDQLVSADATLAGGDQQRLSNWWQTTGALTRD